MKGAHKMKGVVISLGMIGTIAKREEAALLSQTRPQANKPIGIISVSRVAVNQERWCS